jgi:hypothetical protein
VVSARTVKVLFAFHVLQLSLPTVRCAVCCTRADEVHASEIGCAASAPLAPEFLYDLKHVELVRLTHLDGVGVEGTQ